MHEKAVFMFIAVMTAFTAGFLICKFNLEDLKELYRNLKERVYKS